MRPELKLMEKGLIKKIVAEGRELLCRLGAEVHNEYVAQTLIYTGALKKLEQGKQQ